MKECMICKKKIEDDSELTWLDGVDTTNNNESYVGYFHKTCLNTFIKDASTNIVDKYIEVQNEYKADI